MDEVTRSVLEELRETYGESLVDRVHEMHEADTHHEDVEVVHDLQSLH